MKGVFYALFFVVVSYIVYFVWERHHSFRPRHFQHVYTPPTTSSSSGLSLVPEFDVDWVVETLSTSIQFRTVSSEFSDDSDDDFVLSELKKMAVYFEERFPVIHSKCTREFFDDRAVLFRCIGPGVLEEEKFLRSPVLLLAHWDVVPGIVAHNPTEEEDHKQEHPPPPLHHSDPFSGEVDITNTSTIWGRGCVDDKGSVVGLMSGVELLISEDSSWKNMKRPIYLAFGWDEELGWDAVGARKIVEKFREEGIRPFVALDEGGMISRNVLRDVGVDADVAAIGLAEKVPAQLLVEVNVLEGEQHASMASLDSSAMASTLLAEVVLKLINNPMPSHSTEDLFVDFLSSWISKASFVPRTAFTLFRSVGAVLDTIFSFDVKLNAMMRTLLGPVAISAGDMTDVGLMPLSGKAKFALHLHPSDKVEDIIAHYDNLVGEGEATVSLSWEFEPGVRSTISEIDSLQYSVLSQTIMDIFDESHETIVSPMLYIATSDLRFYRGLTSHAYNFMPIIIDQDLGEFEMFHGVDEHISVEGMRKAVQFYYLFAKRCATVELL